jgi:hypothetical protein
MDGMRSGRPVGDLVDMAERLRGMKLPAVSLAIAVKQLCRLNPSFTVGRAATYVFINGLVPYRCPPRAKEVMRSTVEGRMIYTRS